MSRIPFGANSDYVRGAADMVARYAAYRDAELAAGNDNFLTLQQWRWVGEPAPIHRLMTRLAQQHRDSGNTGPCRILNCLGLRAGESSARAGKPVLARDERASTKTTRTVDTWHPILHWTTAEVWDCIRSNVLEYHPAYDLPGVDRLSCVMCIMSSKTQLVAGIKANPTLAREYAAVEVRIGHRFTDALSINDLAAAVLDGTAAEQLPLW